MNRWVETKNDVVIKRFSDKTWYELEKAAYLSLDKSLSFPIELGDGWSVKAPQILRTCDNALVIEMSRLPGKTIKEHLASGIKISWYRVGQATACVHQRFEGSVDNKKVYGDLGVGNVMVCADAKIIGFIDPGTHFGELAPLTQDIFLVLWAINSARLRHGTVLYGAELAFIDGYFSNLPAPVRLTIKQRLYEGSGLTGVSVKLIGRAKSRSYLRQVAVTITFLLWSCLIPRYLSMRVSGKA